MQHIALLGLGIMGLGMARNLLRAGFPLTVWISQISLSTIKFTPFTQRSKQYRQST